MRTPNEPTDEFRLPTPAPKQPDPKADNWRPADTPGFLVNDAGQLKTDLPEPSWPALMQTERDRRLLALVRLF